MQEDRREKRNHCKKEKKKTLQKRLITGTVSVSILVILQDQLMKNRCM